MKEIRDWIDIAFKVVLAVVGIVVGYFFSFQKQQNDDIKFIAEMATSSETPKQLLGVSIADEYFRQDRIPKSVYVAIFSYVNNSSNPTVQAAVNANAATSAASDPSLQQALTQASTSLPIRIYFQIRQESDRAAAAKIESKIETAQIPGVNRLIVPGIELVPSQMTKSLLKCFKKSECEKFGKSLVDIFAQNGVPIELTDVSQKYETSKSIRPNHFEAWFGPLPAQ